MKLTKNDMARAIIQAERRLLEPPHPGDPDVMKLVRSKTAAEMEFTYKLATNSNEFRNRDPRRFW